MVQGKLTRREQGPCGDDQEVNQTQTNMNSPYIDHDGRPYTKNISGRVICLHSSTNLLGCMNLRTHLR